MDADDLMRSEWRRRIAGDYIAAVRAGDDYANARCKLGGLLLGKYYLEGAVRQVSFLMQRCVTKRSRFQNKSSPVLDMNNKNTLGRYVLHYCRCCVFGGRRE